MSRKKSRYFPLKSSEDKGLKSKREMKNKKDVMKWDLTDLAKS